MATLQDLVPGAQDGVWGQIVEDNIVAVNTEVEACVHKTGDETINGIKSFVAKPVVPDASFTVPKIDAIGTRSSKTYLRGDGTWSEPEGTGSTTTANVLGSANNPVVDPNAARPTGLTLVWWNCTTTPVNMANGDINMQKGT